jgi:hypothetical protein
MRLFRLHAYAVDPQRTTAQGPEPNGPAGGAVTIGASLRAALSNIFTEAGLQRRTEVAFDVNPQTRTCDMRNLVLQFGFGSGPQAKAAGLAIARRLSQAMDRRSTACLLVAAAEQNGDERSVTIWTFPRDKAFRFRTGSGGPSIDYLKDVFSQTSRLRKAALLQGRNRRTDFLTARALDLEAKHRVKEVADFWIKRFLGCCFSMKDDAGTRLLARALKQAHDRCGTQAEKQQVLTALMALRSSQQRRWTLKKVAHDFLTGEAKGAFLTCIPEDAAADAVFEIDREALDKAANFHIFELENNVFVSSPFVEVGRTVRVFGDGEEKHLKVEGKVIDEKVRSKHA